MKIVYNPTFKTELKNILTYSLKAQEHYMNIENLVQTLSIRNFKLNSFKV